MDDYEVIIPQGQQLERLLAVAKERNLPEDVSVVLRHMEGRKISLQNMAIMFTTAVIGLYADTEESTKDVAQDCLDYVLHAIVFSGRAQRHLDKLFWESWLRDFPYAVTRAAIRNIREGRIVTDD